MGGTNAATNAGHTRQAGGAVRPLRTVGPGVVGTAGPGVVGVVGLGVVGTVGHEVVGIVGPPTSGIEKCMIFLTASPKLCILAEKVSKFVPCVLVWAPTTVPGPGPRMFR